MYHKSLIKVLSYGSYGSANDRDFPWSCKSLQLKKKYLRQDYSKILEI